MKTKTKKITVEINSIYGNLCATGNIKRIVQSKKTRLKAEVFCRCTPNKKYWVDVYSLLKNKTKSCGCLKKIRAAKMLFKHGYSHTPMWKSWQKMKERCLYSKDISYKNYGGRGIKICQKWMEYINFHNDMFDSYKKGLSLDRIDSNGNYCKENCRWADRVMQAQNRKNVVFLTKNGETHTMSGWAKIIGLTPTAIRKRIDRGLDVDLILKPNKLKYEK